MGCMDIVPRPAVYDVDRDEFRPATQIKAGKWELLLSKDGHPVWGTLHYAGAGLTSLIHHKDLRDLEYVVGRAIKAARDALPETHKHEMD